MTAPARPALREAPRPQGLAYAQARLQARLAPLTDEGLWDHLAASRGLSTYLEEARRGPLAPWVSGLSAVGADPHAVDRGIRTLFQRTVREAAGWVPGSWHPAVLWTLRLPDLPLLHHRQSGQPLPPWASETEVPDLPAGPDSTPLDLAWLRHWRQLWPAMPNRHRAGLDALVGLIQRHRDRFAALSPATTADARRRLRLDLRHLLRLHPLEPAALFAYLALVAAALERLRGELALRAAFPAEAA